MNDAINVLFYMITKTIDFVFNKAEILPNVTIGWIFVSVLFIKFIVSSILTLPRTGRGGGGRSRAAKSEDVSKKD